MERPKFPLDRSGRINQKDRSLGADSIRLEGEIKGILKEKANIALADIIDIQDIVGLGLNTFASDEIKAIVPSGDSIVTNNISRLTDVLVNTTGLSRETLKQKYFDIVGYDPDTDQLTYSQGEISQALKKIIGSGDKKLAEDIQVKFAALGAIISFLNQSYNSFPKPGINYTSNPHRIGVPSIYTDGKPLMQMDSYPHIVIEYGPGLAAVHKIPNEVKNTGLTIFIEKNIFTNQFLAEFSGLFDIQNSYVPGKSSLVCREDGIKSSTDEMLGIGSQNQVDLIVASSVHGAGKDEIDAGIKNGHALLRKGGLFVFRDLIGEFEGFSGRETLDLLRNTFGKNQTVIRRGEGYNRVTGRTRPIFTAVFSK